MGAQGIPTREVFENSVPSNRQGADRNFFPTSPPEVRLCKLGGINFSKTGFLLSSFPSPGWHRRWFPACRFQKTQPVAGPRSSASQQATAQTGLSIVCIKDQAQFRLDSIALHDKRFYSLSYFLQDPPPPLGGLPALYLFFKTLSARCTSFFPRPSCDPTARKSHPSDRFRAAAARNKFALFIRVDFIAASPLKS